MTQKIIGFILSFYLILIIFIFAVVQKTFAQETTSCWVTEFGNPGDNIILPPECGRGRLPCLSGELKYVCAYRNIVDHSVHNDGAYWGFHPATATWRGHLGVDLITEQDANPSIPIYALENGTVIESYNDPGCGNIVKIQDDNGRRHLHCHMIRPGIAKNTVVRRGDIIGYVGHTGGNTSPTDHVHYQVTNNSGVWDDPAIILRNWPNY